MKTEVARTAAEQTEEITALPANTLPDAEAESLTLETAPAEDAEEIRKRMAEVDISDAESIIRFGASAQSGLQEISSEMLADVRNKNLGPAGDSLRDMVTTIRGFSVSALDVRRDKTFWERLSGRTAPFAKFVARYERIQQQLDQVTEALLVHEHTLLKDIKSLDVLYDRTLAFYQELCLYIAAGDAVISDLDGDTIPAQEAALVDMPEDAKMTGAQALRDLRAARDDLERRVHDLKLTRQVTMQALPSIRLVQENDKALVLKINSTLVNTVPLWETQLAQAVTIQRGREAAASIRAANDLTNDLLTQNADAMRSANREIRTEIERGAFDVEAVREANGKLLDTLKESMSITEDAKARRASAEDSLKKMAVDLREGLAAVAMPAEEAKGW
ncbi:toxic anion resistance protein [Falsirhodobacter sp. alg1]|uniref:toxic anion resistance protein n=1 Tax=Falsirhodobacter sp. alg1 TaxID=1472418 RepID=UPI0005EE2A32|nr:toxic anion resistance protein [Falsirhodobacter sp. alg1]